MDKQGFTTTILVDRSADAVFDAILDVRAWWSGDIEGHTDRLGAEFTYRYGDMHWSRQKITELSPGRKVVWHVEDGRLNFVSDKTAWNGTDIVFDIVPRGDKTELRFTHVGLLEAEECYQDCSSAWNYYVGGSLKALITTGKARPDAAEPAESRAAS